MKYQIYAGLNGGAIHQMTGDYASMDEEARALAVEEYQSYEGCHELG